METCLFYFLNFSWKRGKRAWLQTGKSLSHFECAQLMSVWCAMASQCSFQVRWPFHVWMWALLLLILCVRTSHAGGVCVCARFMTYLLLFFFFVPFLTSPKSGFPATFYHHHWPSAVESLGRKCSTSTSAARGIRFFWCQLKKQGLSGWGGGEQPRYLSLSLSGSLLHSTPFIATPTGPALRRSLPAFYRTADVTRLPVLCLFSPSTTVLPLYSWLMVPLCILLPFLWSVSFLPCLPFPALVVFTCTWASTLGRQWSRASMLQKKHKPLTVYQFALERL